MIRASVMGALALICWPGVLHAAGFAIADQGAVSSGLGGAATARTDVPEAGFFNPAAYAMRPGTQLYAGLGVLAPTLTWEGTQASESTTFSLATPPHIHLNHNFDPFALGVSVVAPFGSSIDWPQGWEGRYEVTSSKLQIMEVGVHASLRPIPSLSLAAGFRTQFASLAIQRAIDVVRPEQDARVGLFASGQGFAWQGAMLYTPTPHLQLGLSVRSGSTLQLAGDADFQDVPIELESRAHDTPWETELRTPWRIAAGVAVPWEKMQFSADVEFWTWSSFDALVVDFQDAGIADTRLARDWSNTVSLRFGYEYALMETLRLRTGFAWDPSPANPETLGPASPDSDRVSVAVGASGTWGAWSAHGALGFVGFLGKDAVGAQAFSGAYGGHLLSLNLGVSAHFE